MSLPVQVWPVQSLASRTGASPAGVTVTWVRSVGSGRMGCGIDSRNRLVAEAELALAPAKAASVGGMRAMRYSALRHYQEPPGQAGSAGAEGGGLPVVGDRFGEPDVAHQRVESGAAVGRRRGDGSGHRVVPEAVARVEHGAA